VIIPEGSGMSSVSVNPQDSAVMLSDSPAAMNDDSAVMMQSDSAVMFDSSSVPSQAALPQMAPIVPGAVSLEEELKQQQAMLEQQQQQIQQLQLQFQ